MPPREAVGVANVGSSSKAPGSKKKYENPCIYFAFSTFSDLKDLDWANEGCKAFGIVSFKVVRDPQRISHVILRTLTPKRKNQVRRFLDSINVKPHIMPAEDDDIVTFKRNDMLGSFYHTLVAMNRNDYYSLVASRGGQGYGKVHVRYCVETVPDDDEPMSDAGSGDDAPRSPSPDLE